MWKTGQVQLSGVLLFVPTSSCGDYRSHGTGDLEIRQRSGPLNLSNHWGVQVHRVPLPETLSGHTKRERHLLCWHHGPHHLNPSHRPHSPCVCDIIVIIIIIFNLFNCKICVYRHNCMYIIYNVLLILIFI